MNFKRYKCGKEKIIKKEVSRKGIIARADIKASMSIVQETEKVYKFS